jgi:hypothetical protein
VTQAFTFKAVAFFFSEQLRSFRASVCASAKKSFEDVAKFKHLGTTLTDQNCLHQEINSRLNSGNACYHSVHSRLSSRLLSRNLKVKIYKNRKPASCSVWV